MKKKEKKSVQQRLKLKINTGVIREFIREMLELGPANELKVRRKLLK